MKNFFKLSIAFFTLHLFSFASQAQDCSDFFPFDEGKSWEMTHYNAKAKITGKTLQKIISKKVDSGLVTSVIQMDHQDEKGKSEMTQEYEVYCSNGTFKMSTKALIPQESMQSMESMEVTMDVKDLEMPTVLVPGTTLPDGSIKMTASMNGMTIMNMNIDITNRKVESKETITTDAGTFECFKMTETSTVKMGFMNQTSTTTSWFAPKYGVIKSEHYDKNGKLESYSLMTKFN